MGRAAALVKITADDGTIGWGESVPIPKWSYETFETVTTTIRNYFTPLLIGHNVFDLHGAHFVMNKNIAASFSTGQPMAKAGVDIALHDLIGKLTNQTLAQSWGRESSDKITLSWTLNPKRLDDLDALIDDGWNRGYRHFNVKVAPDPQFDLELCRRLKQRVPHGFLWADANGGYDLATALDIAPKLADIGVDVLEQPLRANHLSGYRRLKKQAALPIIMDEGVVSPSTLVEFIRLDLLDGVAMKPARCGGLLPARRQIEIYSESLRLAEQQMKETQERIRVGTVAETELAASEAEVALRKESLINARSDLDRVRLRLLQLTNPQTKAGWRREILLRDRPGVPEGELDPVESHIHVARLMRPDLNQARLAVQRGDLEIVRTRNGLLPKLDLFVTLGMTGYADSFARSVADRDTQGYDLLVGLRAEYPPANRDARAQHQRAVLSRRQALEAVENLSQLVEVDVRSAFIEINRAREQIAATAATRKLQEEKLRVETEKFRVGKNTSLLVAQAQRDLVSSQIAEVRAVGYYLKSLVALYRLEGSLLERRGIAAPGRSAVDLAAGSRFGQTTD